MENRRKHERFYLAHYLEVINRQTNLPIGQCVNISDGGMMLISRKPLKTKAIFQLRMFLPNTIERKKYIDFIGVSEWCRPDENPDFFNTGLQLRNVTPELTQIIRHLIDNFCSEK